MPRERAMQLLDALQQNEKAEQKKLLAAEARAEEEGQGLVSARLDVPGSCAPSRRFSWRSRRGRPTSFTLRTEVDARKIGVEDQVQLTDHRSRAAAPPTRSSSAAAQP